jgi:two-component system CheB/CheR fusion protein
MPRAAILAGVVDEVLAPDQVGPSLHALLAAGAESGPLRGKGRRKALHELMQLLQVRTGHNFSGYKLNTVLRRIERRMKLHQAASLEDYVAYLRQAPGEVQLLFREMLIGVTSFFRDGAVWEHLRTVTLPQLLARYPRGAALKAWVPACSTGEEAYTLAMVFCEAVETARLPAPYTLQIFATDLDPDAIERARLGLFPRAMADTMPAERLARHFEPCGKGYRVRKALRNMIIFAQQNVISDPPFTKLDLLSCRNLLIYFTPKLQEHLIPLFHYALKPDGVLVLGSADSPGSFTDLFAPDGNGRVYRRLAGPPRRIANYFPTRVAVAASPQITATKNPHMSSSLQTRVEHALLNRHTPAAVLVNAGGDILYVHGRTGGFLEAAAGKANWNVHAMVREELRYELAGLIQRSLGSDRPESTRGLLLRDEDRVRQVAMTAEAQSGEDDQPLVLVTFHSEPVPVSRRRKPKDPQVQELEQQLLLARQELQTVRDEMQTSREELKSANEELQSTNEELQSTNEELTTSKEEMQSLNEELYTVNAELQSKVDDLSLVNGDMKNLLDNTGIAVIFLDNELKIRRFTTQATQIYRLIAADVGRALTDIVGDLQYSALDGDARAVLSSLVYCERQIPTSDGRWFMVRILPYRTVANVVDGLVVTFFNISGLKQLEARLQNNGDGSAAA